MATAQKDLF